MRVILATGIYPPDIGGPATYVERLARGLTDKGNEVTVITYGKAQAASHKSQEPWNVVHVPKSGGPLSRWVRYAGALRQHGKDADVIYAFSSISCGVPLFLSHVRGPVRVLRLGGDFRWERYTDDGGTLGLREWYETKPWLQNSMNGLLKRFDHIVFSTAFQQGLYERFYSGLPLHDVIENASPAGTPMLHARHEPLRILSLGRFVRFKNLPSLIEAVAHTPAARLTLAGEGPLSAELHAQVATLPREAQSRILFRPPVSGVDKLHLLADHDLLVIPSYTDISPNTALEARAAGLPVLLTEETGLTTALAEGAMLRPLRTPQQIAKAIQEAIDDYTHLAERASGPMPARTWDNVIDEHIQLFRSLL